MDPEYTYISVAGKYFCCQSSLASLAWALLIKNSGYSFGIGRRQFPGILKSIIKCHLQQEPDTKHSLRLPVAGHLCIRVHRGYKVFNFSELTTTKVFDHNFDKAEALREISSVRDAGSLDFAPTLHDVDQHNNWYTESFIEGKKSSKNEKFDSGSLYEQVIADHLCQLILSKPVQITELSIHHQKVCDSIKRLLKNSQFDDIRISINEFVRQVSVHLEKTENPSIQLTFSHGDFSFVNFVHTNHSVAVIDWESAQHRSILHDLYNYFLTELYYERAQSNLLAEINNAIPVLSQCLASSEFTSSQEFLALKDIYRWIYYLERIEMLLDREFSEGVLSVIRRSIDVFSNHESRVLHDNNT